MRVLIVDDHPIMREALSLVVAPPGQATEAVCAGSFGDAIQELERGPFATVLLDYCLPDSRGLDAIGILRARWPSTPVMVVSANADPATIMRCLEAGASGYVPKRQTGTVLRHALGLVAGGATYLPPDVLGLTLDDVAAIRPGIAAGASAGTAAAGTGGESATGLTVRPIDPHLASLTFRQRQVMDLMLQGLSNKLICRRLNLAEGTVKVHVSAVLRALGVSNRTQAIMMASRLGMSPQPQRLATPRPPLEALRPADPGPGALTNRLPTPNGDTKSRTTK